MKWFLLLNLIVVILLFILIRKSKNTPTPSKLNFNKKKPLEASEFECVFKAKQENNDTYERVLNILFQYNGETWDAYEVLGLPAGSSAKDAEAAFELAARKMPGMEGFLRAALDAIRHSK